jgi:hypothetical protein
MSAQQATLRAQWLPDTPAPIQGRLDIARVRMTGEPLRGIVAEISGGPALLDIAIRGHRGNRAFRTAFSSTVFGGERPGVITISELRIPYRDSTLELHRPARLVLGERASLEGVDVLVSDGRRELGRLSLDATLREQRLSFDLRLSGGLAGRLEPISYIAFLELPLRVVAEGAVVVDRGTSLFRIAAEAVPLRRVLPILTRGAWRH